MTETRKEAARLGPWTYPHLFLSGFVARLPYGIAAVGLLTAGTQRGYPPGITGLLPTAFTVALALATPWWGRGADRYGMRRVLLPCAVITVLGATTAALAPTAGIALIGAALIGVGCPPITAMMRTIWIWLLPDPDSRRRAMTWESIAAEGVHIIGRILTAGVSLLSARISLLLLGVFGLTGSALLIGNPHTAHIRPAISRPNLAVLSHSRARRLLLLTVLLMSSGHGAAATALIGNPHGPSAGAALMAIWGVGSAIGGAIYLRSSSAHSTPVRTVRVGLVVFLVLCPLAAATLSAQWSLAAASVLVLGIPLAPTSTGIYLEAADLAAPGRETETNALVTSAVVIGFGIGTAATGFAEGLSTPVSGGLTAAALFTLAAVLTHLFLPRIGKPPSPASGESAPS